MRSIEYLKNNGVDINHALELLGDIETYNETILEFQKGLDEKIRLIKEYYQKEDMPNYAIYVHSLKSDCKYLGFIKLADIAYQHELESKANHIDFVKQYYNALMKEIEVVKKLTNDYISGGEETENNQTSAFVETLNTDDIILVADDSEVIRIFVKKIFDADYELAFASNGEEALNSIKEHEEDGKIKAILLDLNMPKIDGFAVLDYLKQKDLFQKMPVTIISGDSSSEAINKAFTYPIIDMINKPFSEQKIKEAVEKTISYTK